MKRENIRIVEGLCTHEHITIGAGSLLCQLSLPLKRYLVVADEDGVSIAYWAGPTRPEAEFVAANLETELVVMGAELEAAEASKQ